MTTARGRRGPASLHRRWAAVLCGVLVAVALVIVPATCDTTSRRSSTVRTRRDSPRATAATTAQTIQVTRPANIYAGIGPKRLSLAVREDLPRVYVPDGASNQITVIDPTTGRVVDSFGAGLQPQHVVPSWDLRTLWVLDNSSNDVFPIDPRTARPGPRTNVDDPYNMYFTPNGSSAIIVAEAHQRLDFRDPHTMQFRSSIPVPGCAGINHADYSGDDRYMIVSCEFAGSIAKIDTVRWRVVGLLHLGAAMSAAGSTSANPMPGRRKWTPRLPSMPQDVRAGPDGRHFYVADMAAGGVHVIDGRTLSTVGFIPTGIGAHGITPSRDGKRLYVANRGSVSVNGAPHGPGSVSVIDPVTNTVVSNWPVPFGGSPDMGNISADGTRLWLSGRFDAEVYVFDTTTGKLAGRIPVGRGPHGLAVWPQPGSISLGHTGNMR